jgi:hypothetical protein
LSSTHNTRHRQQCAPRSVFPNKAFAFANLHLRYLATEAPLQFSTGGQTGRPSVLQPSVSVKFQWHSWSNRDLIQRMLTWHQPCCNDAQTKSLFSARRFTSADGNLYEWRRCHSDPRAYEVKSDNISNIIG